jgi:hypothetical protein
VFDGLTGTCLNLIVARSGKVVCCLCVVIVVCGVFRWSLDFVRRSAVDSRDCQVSGRWEAAIMFHTRRDGRNRSPYCSP